MTGKRGPIISQEEARGFLDAYRDGANPETIAQRTGRSKAAVSRHLRHLGAFDEARVELDATIRRLWEAGATSGEIAGRVGMSPKGVLYRANVKLGLPSRRAGNPRWAAE